MKVLELLLLFFMKPILYQIRDWIKEYELKKELEEKQRKKNVPKQCNRNIAVLGMKSAGKTRLHCALRNVDYINLETSVERYPAYTYRKSNGTYVHIQEGFDIGGGNNFRSKYVPMIKEADIVFFLFDLFQYRRNEEYRKETRSRLEFITRKCKDWNHTLVTLITHKDLFTPDELSKYLAEYKNEISSTSTSSTPYADAVTKYKFYPINTKDKKDINKIIDSVL